MKERKFKNGSLQQANCADTVGKISPSIRQWFQFSKPLLDTGDDYLYFKIHQEIKNRIKKMKNITEDKILDLIKEELDNFETNRKHA